MTSDTVKVIQGHENCVHDGFTDVSKWILGSALWILHMVAIVTGEYDVE